MQAGAAHLILLDQANGEIQLARTQSGCITSGATAEDEDVKFLSHDVAPLHRLWGLNPRANEFFISVLFYPRPAHVSEGARQVQCIKTPIYNNTPVAVGLSSLTAILRY